MISPAVSIIIPFHNSQKTLERTLVSVRQQTLESFEVLMVNDGSTDNSLKIAKKYETKDSRFKIIQQRNKGVSEARNNGLSHAAGKYIMFSDSDDWMHKNSLKSFVYYAEQESSDLVISWFYRVIDTFIMSMGHINGIQNLSKEQFAKYMSAAPANFYYGVVWNKCYRKDIIIKNNIQFSCHLNWCEDELFNLEYLQFSNKITAIDIPLYYYVKRSDSICESQLNFRKAFLSKYEILGYYKDLYKSINLYKDNKLKINSFMFATAKDTGTPEYLKLKMLQQANFHMKYPVKKRKLLKLVKTGKKRKS